MKSPFLGILRFGWLDDAGGQRSVFDLVDARVAARITVDRDDTRQQVLLKIFGNPARALLLVFKLAENNPGLAAALIERALENITALCGDLQGIAGRQLQDLLPPALDPARALPGASEGGESEGPDDAKLAQLLLNLLPGDGGTVGNGSLSDLFVERIFSELGLRVTGDDYERCKDALLADGRIRRGKGRGGSVCRVVASAAE